MKSINIRDAASVCLSTIIKLYTHFYVLVPNPTRSLPAIIVATFGDMAIKTHPIIVGMAEILIMLSLPVISITQPPIIALTGVIILTTLAVKSKSSNIKR